VLTALVGICIWILGLLLRTVWPATPVPVEDVPAADF
jgi:hypothetical protein